MTQSRQSQFWIYARRTVDFGSEMSRNLAYLAALAIFLPLCNTSLAGEEELEPWWRHSLDNQWCFYYPLTEACLPSNFEVYRFESGHAAFRYAADNDRSRLISFEMGSPLDKGEDSLPGDALVLKSSFGSDRVLVTEFAADLTKKGSHPMSVFVLVFDETFSLTLVGTETEELRALAYSLIEQWSD